MTPVAKASTFCVFAAILSAQSADKRPVFEAASIKPADRQATGSTFNTPPGRLEATNWNLRQYIMIAYGLKNEDQIVGGPKWADFDRYDLVGKLAPADVPTNGPKANEEQVLLAFQALLADRFRLVMHHDSRLTTGYALTVAKGGPKLKAAESGGRHSNRWNATKLTSVGVSMANLASILTRIVGAPVGDATELPGEFDVTLEWASDDSPAATEKAPPLFAAIQQQLGLKLESRRVAQDFLVIDSAERPPEN